MNAQKILDQLDLQQFQQLTVCRAYTRMFVDGQMRFLIADEVGLGKTKVAQGLIALATATRKSNVLYLASSGHIVGQNMGRLTTTNVEVHPVSSLSLLAVEVHEMNLQGKLIGLTPIKDLREDHFGSMHERGLLCRLLMRKHRRLMEMEDVLAFFRGRFNVESFKIHLNGRVPRALRDAFEHHLDDAIIAQLSDAQLRDKHKRAIVGKLRAVLATCAMEKLDPALIIVDEIQKFSDVLLAKNPTRQVKYLRQRKMVVLSATPYQPGATGDHAGPDPHKGFIDLVRFLNEGHPDRVSNVERALEAMRSALLEPSISRARVENAVSNLGNHLKTFMVRTERPFDAHVERSCLPAPLDDLDLKALRQAMQLLKKSTPSGKNKRHRFPEFVELWKSTPYLVSALGDRYVAGKDLKNFLQDKGFKRLPTPAALTVAQLTRSVPLAAVTHPRLRAMTAKMGNDAKARRLWLPPTLPYIADVDRIADDPPSKTLVFTSWGAAPPAIATALNLLVEPRPGRVKDLEFMRSARRGGPSEPATSVYVIAAPLWKFAQASDPFAVRSVAGEALSGAEMVAGIRKQLVDAGILTVSRAKPAKKVLDLAINLNAEPQYPPPKGQQRSYLDPARALMKGKVCATQATVTMAQANELAELAAAAPGTCAYRALRRAIPALAGTETEAPHTVLFAAAIAIGNSITRLFQRPMAVAIVEGGTRVGRKAPYWRRVLRFCLEHDLQSVLDEYVFLLVRDKGSETNIEKLASGVAQAFELALSTTGVLQAVRPKPKEKSYNGAMYARALGEHDSLTDDDDAKAKQLARKKAKDQKTKKTKRPHERLGNPLLAAFNSPFPPFVLTTTSTGQEGLDMHRYCRRLVHWNLPTTPLALEQREGRVDRFLSLGVRTNIARLGFSQNKASGDDPWALLIKSAKMKGDQHQSVLAPLWHFGEGQPIKAIAINVPFSREETAWKRLQEEASWYRLVLGQPNPHDLLGRLSNSTDSNRAEIVGIKLDLSPEVRRSGSFEQRSPEW